MFQLLREGLRAGCEWVDVEACWSEERHVHSFTRDARQHYSRTSRLLGSLHVTQTLETDQETEELFMRTSLGGEAHMLKVVTGAVCSDDCDRVHRAGQRVSDSLGVRAETGQGCTHLNSIIYVSIPHQGVDIATFW